MHIALAEDEDSKREKIRAFVSKTFVSAEISETRSVRATTRLFRTSARTIDLLLLDMSLPTFDIAAGEPGGRPQGFGGIEVVRYLKKDGISVPIIVITQHPAIARDEELIDLDRIGEMVRMEAPLDYKGLIYYNTLTGQWRDQLEALIRVVFEGGSR